MYTNKEIWKVGYPIFLSLLAQNIINVTDTAFLGRVGEVELGASAMGGLFYICLFTIAFGFSTGSQIIIARRNGEERYDQIGPVMVQGVFFLLALAAFAFGLMAIWGKEILRLLISSDAIWQATVKFLDWRIYGFFFAFFGVMFRALFVGITRTKVLTLNSIVMAVTNIILDYLLIFGHAGFPKMGIEGAAIASVIAELVSLIFFILYTRCTVDLKKYGLDRFREIDFSLLKRVLNISIFVMMQYFLALITWFVFFIVVEHLGQRELAIANIVRSIYIVVMIPVSALSTTVNTLVSNTIGEGNTADVIPIIRKVCKMTCYIALVILAVMYTVPNWLISIYTNDASLVSESVPSIYVIGVSLFVAAIGNIAFSGVSGTGNTRSALALECCVMVCYIIYVYIVGIVWRQPVEICFTTEVLYYVGLLIVSVIYLKKGTWQNKRI